MLAPDTNILVYAHRAGLPRHREARRLLARLAEGRAPYALFWPSLCEFLRVVTRHRVFSPADAACHGAGCSDRFSRTACVRVLAETPEHGEILRAVLRRTPVEGNLMHDAHLVALALEHGVEEILTLDGDCKRFPQVRSRNPFA